MYQFLKVNKSTKTYIVINQLITLICVFSKGTVTIYEFNFLNYN